jgi:type II restriction enzyme
MSKLEQAQEILKALGMPAAQQNEISAYTLLALCNLKEDDAWPNASNKSATVTKGIMTFISENYMLANNGTPYAPNSRETFRRQVLHQFEQGRIVNYNPDNPALLTNSPNAHYALTPEALEVIRTYDTSQWEEKVKAFIEKFGSLNEEYLKRRQKQLVPVTLRDGTILHLSPGKHNEVQANIVEVFAPRFAPGSTLLYVGDTAKKVLHIDAEKMAEIGIPMTEHGKLPDVILLDTAKDWLFLVEAVTSHGPVSPKRVHELEEMLINCKLGKIYVTAFPDFSEFRKHINNVAWETEVWIAENPDHMIHYNGEKFFGPR